MPSAPQKILAFQNIPKSQEILTRKRRLKRRMRRKNSVTSKLVWLSNRIKRDPLNAQLSDFLIVYAVDELLTIDAHLEQEKMKRRKAWLYVIGIMIIISFAVATATVLTAGTGLSMAIILTVVMVSKIEGIVALLTTMKAASMGACRQVFNDVDRAQSNVEKKHPLTRFQQFVLNIKKRQKDIKDIVAVSSNVTPQDSFKACATNVLRSISAKVRGCLVKRDLPESLIEEMATNFTKMIEQTEKLLQQTNTTAPQDQMAWVELLPLLLSVSENPFDLEKLGKLEEKLSEVSLAADARIKQEHAQTFAKIILFASLIITIACIAVIFVAMMWFGATVASPIVLAADALITLSKIIFWAGGVPATVAGSVDVKRYQKEKSAVSHHVQHDPSESKPVDSQSPLQNISFFASKICASLRRVQPNVLPGDGDAPILVSDVRKQRRATASACAR